MERVLVIIPTYNEAAAIARVIDSIRVAVPKANLLVVDDGSRDGTAAIAKGCGVRVVSHIYNMGYGVAIQTGYKYAVECGYDYIVQLDGDGQHDPDYILSLLEPLKGGEADFVIGSRYLDPGSYTPPFCRRMGVIFFRSIIRLVTGEKVTDPTSGYQAFTAEVARFFATEVFPCDYPDADILITLKLARFRIRELPVRMYASSNGKSMHRGVRPLYYVFKMLLSILVTLLRDHRPYRR